MKKDKLQRKVLKKLRKSSLNPRPATSGASAIDYTTTSWGAGDDHANDGPLDVVPPTIGAEQRDNLALVQMRAEAAEEKDPARKAALVADIEQLETKRRLVAHALKAGNGGDIDAETLRSLVSGRSDARDVAAVVDIKDDLEQARAASKAAKKSTDALEREGLEQSATLARLRAFHRLAGPQPSISAAILRAGSGGARKGSRGTEALQSQLDGLTERFEKAGEATTKAELDQQRRDVASRLLLAKLRELHGGDA